MSHRGDVGALRERARGALARRELDAECKRLVALVRERCPDAFEPDPLPAGTVGPALPVEREQAIELLRLAARGGATAHQLWERDGDELMIGVGELGLRTQDGLVVVDIPVSCDQTGPDRVLVAFAVGSEARPAGMVAAAEGAPRGPAVVIEVWGDELTALAWRSLTGALAALAREAGRDVDGAGLVPVGVEASRGGLLLRTIARHGFDRVQPA
jgi:hypothetical protein